MSYGEKVGRYWPEFSQGGKGEITVADVMRHAGGVPWSLPGLCPQAGGFKGLCDPLGALGNWHISLS